MGGLHLPVLTESPPGGDWNVLVNHSPLNCLHDPQVQSSLCYRVI